ncbi:MAG: TIGR00266 family protein [Lachnospirales bacterium]
MNYQLSNSSSAPIATITLNNKEEIKLERGSMIYHESGISIEGKTNGGLLGALTKSIVSNESMFISHAVSNRDGAKLGIAPASLGAIAALHCGEKQYVINDGSYLACDKTVELQIKKQKKLSTTFLGGTGGFFNIHTSGEGDVLVNAFGDIIAVDLNQSTPFIVDNGHVVAWETTLDTSIRVASGAFGFMTGEGLVVEFLGKGRLYIQTRHIQNFAYQISQFITPAN